MWKEIWLHSKVNQSHIASYWNLKEQHLVPPFPNPRWDVTEQALRLQWEYSWSSVAKIHRTGWYCSFGSREKEVSTDWWERSVCGGFTQWSSPLTSQSLCGIELFAIRLSMEGQWKDFWKHSLHGLVEFRVIRSVLVRITGSKRLVACVSESVITALGRCSNYLERHLPPKTSRHWLYVWSCDNRHRDKH